MLTAWREALTLTKIESNLLAGELKALDQQIERLKTKCLRIAVFGRVGVGKSSLLNALLEKQCFATDVAHGCTRKIKAIDWDLKIGEITKLKLVDTPGIDEVSSAARGHLARRVCLKSDLVLFVIDSDLTSIELDAIKELIQNDKPILIILNRCDQWSVEEQTKLIKSIRNRLPNQSHDLNILAVAAAPRKVKLQETGRVRSQISEPLITPLKQSLFKFIQREGDLLLALNALRQADNFYHSLKSRRLKRSKVAAQTLIGRFATFKASGVAINPFLILDLAGCLAMDTALIMQLSKLYGLKIGSKSARNLIKRLSIYSSFVGGAQLGVQFTLGALRQLLIFASPFTSGLSLAPAAPIALVQAAVAVHTTKLTGRLAAKALLNGSHGYIQQPSAMLKRLSLTDPDCNSWLRNWPQSTIAQKHKLQSLLP